MKKDDCIFCKIANGEIPSSTVYEDDDFRVILDIAPAAKGHALILPKEHFANIFELDGVVAGKLFTLATKVAPAIKEEMGCSGLNVVQNNGASAGQTVDHFHLHLIPRNEGDDVSVKWVPKESDPEENAKLAEKIAGRM
ncbi:MAG: HIT family protein [Lachnospiraceae bacterium]|nr:HIT family protein [Lachnospiraceae bacterium]